ncbi:MAG: TonB-dependent receptor [candidate division Zixibacteria bacterium]|nr:TonB-dependent receptor [candidate division Zixibacteria bacterium]
MKRFIFLLVFYLLFAIPVFAAGNNLTGRIIDQDNNPIANVTVKSSDIIRTVKADDNGVFSVSTKTDGRVTLIFSHAGYTPKSVRVSSGETDITVTLIVQIYPMQGITVSTGRAVEGVSAVAFENLDRTEIENNFDIGEFPELLEMTPNVYSYSDAGGGLGYSYMSIRGFNARRTPVYINGVPLNDPEDHALYFIDLPDFASYVDNIQVQRGVGNSLYGDASFGGSVNILTSAFAHDQKVEMVTGYGGFLQDGNTIGLMRKSSVFYSTGMLNGGWSLTGRWVKQFSDGYRKSSWYDGTAYYFSLGRIDPNMITTVNIYGGPIKTHAAWDGVSRETLNTDRRTALYTYNNETDNFNQPHFELHNIYTLNERTTLNNTVYLIRGKGFYEQLKTGETLSDYNLTGPDSDIIRRKWVNKYQLGLNSHIDIADETRQFLLGGSYYFFESDHWGEVLWANELENSHISLESPHKYYEYFGKYHNMSTYASYRQKLNEKLSVSGNLQLRYLQKSIHTTAMGPYEQTIYDLNWLFLSPRIGLNYEINDNLSSYFSFSVSSHEPNDDMIDDSDDPSDTPQLEIIDSTSSPIKYGNATVDAERIYDFELGTTYRDEQYAVSLNLFWMEYHNALVPDGKLNDDNQPTYGNADRSVHRGLELTMGYQVLPELMLSGNYSYNDFWIKKYDKYDWGGSMTEIRDVATPNFPRYIANLRAEYKLKSLQFIYSLRAVGRHFITLDGRYVDINGVSTDVSIAPYTVSSIKGMLNLGNVLGGAEIMLEARIDNLFDKKYETWGYGWGGTNFMYWPASERNWFMNLKLSL